MSWISKTLTAVVLAFGLATTAIAEDVYVNGYFRNDGTYVRPHYRTAPNNSVWDNYSTKGNLNPYTGQWGTKDPYQSGNGGWGGSNSNGWNGYNNGGYNGGYNGLNGTPGCGALDLTC